MKMLNETECRGEISMKAFLFLIFFSNTCTFTLQVQITLQVHVLFKLSQLIKYYQYG